MFFFSNPHFYTVAHQSRVKKKHTEGTWKVSLENLLSCRLREGYSVRNVLIDEAKNTTEIRLVLPWMLSTNIEYLITSGPVPGRQWKNNSSDVPQCHFEIIVDGCYEFLHDVTCSDKKPIRSLYRKTVITQFWSYIKNLSNTDQILTQLHSFALNPAYYIVPDSLKNGVPLFYFSTNPATRILQSNDFAPSLTRNISSLQFASFWKTLCLLDINVWQKWMHAHRIGVILQHDTPLQKNLHLPNSSGRYAHVQCRQAMNTLHTVLSELTSFVLVENHSYIKLLFEYEKLPTNFLVSVSHSQENTKTMPYQQKQSDSGLYADAMATLSKYLMQQRWIYTLQYESYSSLDLKSASKILYTLTKVRLHEGFHFSHSSLGIIYMVQEIPVEVPKESCCNLIDRETNCCVVQYIIFPPHTNTTVKDCISEEDDTELTEADGELQLITECWIEPQYGIAIMPPETEYLNGLKFEELPSAIHQKDLEITQVLTTFEHLCAVCQKTPKLPDTSLPIQSKAEADIQVIEQEVQDTQNVPTTENLDSSVSMIENPDNEIEMAEEDILQMNALPLPIYVYNCVSSSIVNQLVQLHKCSPVVDKYENHIFDCECHQEDSKKSTKLNGQEDGKKTVDLILLKEHCSLIEKAFSKAFAYGVYRSLLNGFDIQKCDAIAAIDNICEESLPDYFFFFCPAEDDQLEDDSVMNEREENPEEDKKEPDKCSNLADEDVLSKSCFNTNSSVSSIDKDTELNSLQDKNTFPASYCPLFLLCTKFKSSIKKLSATRLPTCLNDIINCLDSENHEISLDDLKVTLDIYCLTIPPDVENPEVTRRRIYSTSFSSNSPVP
ncbi:KICSTOR complex protein SZT2 [Caerostris extrusa]|uniref:KICSTOR complex protein SZT2 n=1 Tax=Caerostris extrusa TaxID=172846 RepID=A0AAV4S6L5_CAEEX|nr:KICSTOR complex protein SZT2 [Caerostris extrusa]